MNNTTYQILKRANRDRVINHAQFKKQRFKATPYIKEKIDYFLGDINVHDSNWGLNLSHFTTNFLSDSSSNAARDRLDETVTTFLLFLSNQLSGEKLSQTFVNRGRWENEYSWMMLFKWSVYTVITLAYEIEWRSEYFFFVDDMTIDLMKGHSKALRTFTERIGIKFSSPMYPAEMHFVKMDYHSARIFGPYYWRMIHFIAEAFALRSDSDKPDILLAKKLWREFTIQSLYRTLRCGICMHHYKSMVSSKYKEKLLNTPDKDYPNLWFTIHNDVNERKNVVYSEADFEKDRKFMKSGLLERRR